MLGMWYMICVSLWSTGIPFFLHGNGPPDPVVDPRPFLQSCDFTTFVGVFNAPKLLL